MRGLPQTKAGMDGTDRVIEFLQQVVRIIQKSIRKDIYFGGFQDTEAF